MENIFVARFRKILEKLTANLKDKYATINRNNSYFAESVAQNYNAEVEKEINKAVADAQKSAWRIMCSVSLALNQWQTPQGKNISRDAELFNGSYPLSVAEVNKMIMAHSANYTMLSLIQKYADSNNMNVHITTAEEKEKVYYKFYTGCLSAIEQIAKNRGNYDNSTYANNVFCMPLYSVIGDGRELEDLKQLSLYVDKPLTHYQNPAEEANYNFTFKPVQRNEQSVNLGI